jgi:hypothetical protein
MRKLRFWPRAMAEMASSSVEGGQPANVDDPTYSIGYELGRGGCGGNLALTLVSTGDVGVLNAVTLLKASLVQSSSTVLLRGESQIWLSWIG